MEYGFSRQTNIDDYGSGRPLMGEIGEWDLYE